ncbi:MAG: hypothetical protein ABII79_05870 [bacterium]
MTAVIDNSHSHDQGLAILARLIARTVVRDCQKQDRATTDHKSVAAAYPISSSVLEKTA